MVPGSGFEPRTAASRAIASAYGSPELLIRLPTEHI